MRLILNKDVHYFDFAASSPALECIEKEMQTQLKNYANLHSKESSNAMKSTAAYENARQEIKKSLKLPDNYALIACGHGATSAIKKFQELQSLWLPHSLKERLLKISQKEDLPLVILSPYEHHSMELSFRACLCELEHLELINGELDLNKLARSLKLHRAKTPKRPIYLCISAASNVTGQRSNLARLSELAQTYSCLRAIDLSAIIAHENVEPSYFDAGFISSHKVLGAPSSPGLLVIKKALLPNMPSYPAGGVVRFIDTKSAEFIEGKEQREEPGTAPILGLIKAGLAFSLRSKYLAEMSAKEAALTSYFFQAFLRFKRDCDAVLYAFHIKNRLPIFSLNVLGFSPFFLARKLSDDFGIQSRAGCACAASFAAFLLNNEGGFYKKNLGNGPSYGRFDCGRFDYGQNSHSQGYSQNLQAQFSAQNPPAFLRFSFSFLNTNADIDYLFASLTRICQKSPIHARS